jgi:hypothetical protein
MPNLILDLEVNRVDLVDEGANSEAFIKLYKRKESVNMDFNEILEKMKPEHREVVIAELKKAKEEIPEAIAADLAKAKKDLEDSKKPTEEPSMEEVLKSLDPTVKVYVESLQKQKEAAELIVKQAAEKAVNDEAIAKSKEIASLPVEADKLVSIAKSATPEIFEVLKAASKLIAGSDLLTEVGKSRGTTDNADAWQQIEKKADAIAKDEGISKQKAIAKAIQENPDLYKRYLQGEDGGVE